MSLQLFVVDKLIRLQMKRRFAKNPDVMELRALMAEMAPAAVPAHVHVDQVTLGGVKAEKLRTGEASDSRALLYIHGGGFVGGAPASHHALTWRLAEKIAVPVYAIDYRLAPEHPFPAGLDDCVSAYRALLDKGIAAASIVVGGDSAGGNLTLALALRLKTLGLPQPAALICLSPATDLAEELPSHYSNAKSDAMFDAGVFPSVLKAYCPNHDPKDPLISPLRGDVAGLPPTLIQCSDAEMLRDDGVFMAERLRAARVHVTLQVWPKVFHVWQVAADILPEARTAIGDIATFARKALRIDA